MSTPIAALNKIQLTCDAEPGACVAVFRRSVLSLEIGDELLQRVGRKVLRGNNDPGRLDDESERREVSERVVGRRFVERLAPDMGAAVGKNEFGAVGRRSRHAERADRSARPGGIFHYHAAA